MRRRIVGLVVLTVVLATMLLGVPFAAAVFRYYEFAERMELVHHAYKLAVDTPATALRNHGPVELPASVAGAEVAAYDVDGQLVSGSGPERADSAVLSVLHGTEAAHAGNMTTVVCAVPVTSRNQIVGSVRVARTNRRVYENAAVACALMLAFAAGTVLVTWLVSLRLVRNLARPLEQVSAKARQLGEGDFSVRCERSGIPEIDSLSQCLNNTADRLVDILERERAFSANASHQLRTPLTGLRLSLETALEGGQFDQTYALEKALSAVNVLENTVDDLLIVARDTHRVSQPLELEPLISELLARWQDNRAASGRWLRTIIQPDAPTAHASKSAVRQILTVLVDNALTHGSGTVTVIAREASGSLAIDVSDQGSCADVDETQIFQRRVNNAASHGIGLALARSLAQAEGGQLNLTSRAPTSFSLFLPAGRESEAAEVPEKSAAH